MAAALARRVRFGPFEADLSSGELWRDGTAVPLQDLPFRLLAALLEQPGEVVSRSELATRVWGTDTFVDATAGLNTAVAKLREALGDDADRPAYVETLPKRGYRFVATVHAGRGRRRGGFGPVGRVAARGRAGPARRRSASASRWIAAAAARSSLVGVAAWVAYDRWIDDRPVRVAVVLFDNETGRPEMAPLAQALTDATVASLTAEPGLAVIGNAAVLRTSRPFRDIAAIRDALGRASSSSARCSGATAVSWSAPT